MARLKETIWQSDFSLGAVRGEAVERDDVPIVERSVREALNTVVTETGQIEDRPGSLYIGETTARFAQEIDLGAGRVFNLHLTPTGLVVYNPDGTAAYTNASTTWTAVATRYGTFTFASLKFWVVPDPDSSSVLIGAQNLPIHRLSLTGSTWALALFAFDLTAANARRMPFWRHYQGVTIQPSARTGAITLTASSPIWTSAHNGLVVRYVDRQILLGATVSATVINATVIETLPPTYDITVATAADYLVGDAVEHSSLGGLGIVTGIAGAVVKVLATSSYDGFDAVASPKLVAPNAAQVISVVSSVAPAASGLWDIQIASAVHGYAGSAARHKGRLFLCDFPSAPLAFASSVIGSVYDFTMGPNDADGFVETIGADRGGELKFIVSTSDLLFLTTKGLFYQPTRDAGVVTPETIGPVPFSALGVANVQPVTIEDGCVFVDAVGKRLHACVLAGDVYRNWRAEPLVKFTSGLITAPVSLGATSVGSDGATDLIFVINADGTMAVAQWDRTENIISWRNWTTWGLFQRAYQCFGRVHIIVTRTIDGVSRRMHERFENGLYMDCACQLAVSTAHPGGQAGVTLDQGVTAFATHLIGHTATLYMEGWDLGNREIDGDGKPLDDDAAVLALPAYEGTLQIGLTYPVVIVPWARRSVRTQRGTRQVKRLVQMFITVQATGLFEVDDNELGGYRAGDDLSVPPPFRDQQYKVTFAGASNFERKEIRRNRPGPFRLLKLGYRVVV